MENWINQGLESFQLLKFSIKEVLDLTEKTTELSGEQNKYLEQIAEYKEQIKTLNRLLENQQILTKQAQDQNQNLLLENVEIKKELNEEKKVSGLRFLKKVI